jgi:hypothetical protein
VHPLPDSKQREVFAIACHIFTPNLMTTRHNSRTRCPSKTKPKPPLLQETATETPDLFEKTNRSAPQSSRFRQFHQQIHTKLNTYPSSDSWRGARLPAGAYKRAEFPAAFPEKNQAKKIPAPQTGRDPREAKTSTRTSEPADAEREPPQRNRGGSPNSSEAIEARRERGWPGG